LLEIESEKPLDRSINGTHSIRGYADSARHIHRIAFFDLLKMSGEKQGKFLLL